LTYPTLFLYGLGGFEDFEQSTPRSFKWQVKHLFSLGFQEHYSFLFTVFNILQHRAILLQTSLKVKQTSLDHFAHQFCGISLQAVRNVCNHLAQQNTKFEAMTAEEQHILRLMKEVNVINSHVPGSLAASITMRNEV
jgi:hypothetical protein